MENKETRILKKQLRKRNPKSWKKRHEKAVYAAERYVHPEYYERKLKAALLHNELEVQEIDRASKTLGRILELKKQMI